MTDGNGNVRHLERRDTLLKWARRLCVLALCLGVAFGGLRLYGGWRQKNLARQVEHFAARGDFQNAVLVARRLLQLDENNLAACRAMAEMAEKSSRPEALEWRRKIAILNPNSIADKIALARCALHFAHLELAERVLASLAPAARDGTDYHQLRGAIALAQHRNADADTHFAAAALAAPENPQLALNLHLLRLTTADKAVADQARQSLIALADKAAVRMEALRALAAEALAKSDLATAQKWTTSLNAQPDATFSDALLSFQANEGTPAATAALAFLQEKAVASPEKTAELITWLNRHGKAQVAVEWKPSLPPEIRETQPVPLAIAESFSFLQDWKGLHAWVEGKNWSAYESLRLAVESHALHRLSLPDGPSMETQVVWRAALKAAQARPEQLLAIAQLAEGWGYAPEAEEAWWLIASSNQNTRTALSALQNFYKQKQDARGLWRVAKRALELNPDDLAAANNCASLGLLLSGDNTSRRLASKLHTNYPTNRAFTATYAYALQTEGRGVEGLKLLEGLKENELQYPSIAAYYVVMLVENGNLERARTFLVYAQRAKLLPEEQALLTAAARKLFPAGPEAVVAR